MTGLLAVEAIAAGTASLGDSVVIQSDVADEGGGAVGLAQGDVVSLQDLLYLMLLGSENDAATAVGTHIGGSRSDFVDMMNARAAQLGLTGTRYVTISGRDPEDLYNPKCVGNAFQIHGCDHHSTARDLAALTRFALTKPLFRTIVATPQFTTAWTSPPPLSSNTTTNTNQLLQPGADAYPGTYGVKTGTTDRAGANLVSAARNGSEHVIAVILGAEADGSTPDRFDDSKTLLDFGFAVIP